MADHAASLRRQPGPRLDASSHRVVSLCLPLPPAQGPWLLGDVKLTLTHAKKKKFAMLWFHTAFTDGATTIRFGKAEIDKACKQKAEKIPDGFAVELTVRRAGPGGDIGAQQEKRMREQLLEQTGLLWGADGGGDGGGGGGGGGDRWRVFSEAAAPAPEAEGLATAAEEPAASGATRVVGSGGGGGGGGAALVRRARARCKVGPESVRVWREGDELEDEVLEVANTPPNYSEIAVNDDQP